MKSKNTGFPANSGGETFKKSIEEMETQVIMKKEVRTNMKTQLADIRLAVSWREMANRYFSKSCSWFYHKMDGIDGNGKPTDFTAAEKEQLRGALCDLADRIRRAADTIR